MLVLGSLEIGMLLFLFLKGGSGYRSFICSLFLGGIGLVECGTVGYWLLVIATIPYLGSFTYFAGKYLRYKHQRKVAAQFRFLVMFIV